MLAQRWLIPGLGLRASYTMANYRYTDFTIVDPGGVTRFDGNREPNTPVHLLGAELRFEHPSGFFATVDLRHFSNIYTNDANTADSPSATISNLSAGWQIERGDFVLTPFAGIRNWTGAKYDGSLRPNAFGGRYYEPAPEVELYFALDLGWGR